MGELKERGGSIWLPGGGYGRRRTLQDKIIRTRGWPGDVLSDHDRHSL